MTFNLIKQQERDEERIETLVRSVTSLVKKLNISASEAMDYLDIPDKDRTSIFSSLEARYGGMNKCVRL